VVGIVSITTVAHTIGVVIIHAVVGVVILAAAIVNITSFCKN